MNPIAESEPSSLPDIFELNIFCLHDVFEWLTLEELIAVGRTCKRFHQAAGDFFPNILLCVNGILRPSWLSKWVMEKS